MFHISGSSANGKRSGKFLLDAENEQDALAQVNCACAKCDVCRWRSGYDHVILVHTLVADDVLPTLVNKFSRGTIRTKDIGEMARAAGLAFIREYAGASIDQVFKEVVESITRPNGKSKKTH